MTLAHLSASELSRFASLEVEPADRSAIFADACRINTLYMVARAGSGHLGTSFSCLDVLSWLHLDVLGEGDRYFSSKGHDAPGLYSVLIGLGRLDYDLLHRLRRLGGLPGHPDVRTTPLVHTNTGSLGMGISKARGFVLADRLRGRHRSVYVVTGDGELQEGQFWESLQPTASRGLGEITVIVDHNKLQSDTWVSQVSDLGDLEARVAAHGWAVGRCDGHDAGALASTLDDLRTGAPQQPRLIVADTRKGAGVTFMEPDDLPVAGDSLYAYHSGAPSPDEYDRALEELSARLDARLAAVGADPAHLERVEATRATPPERPQRLIGAYAEALAAEGDADDQLVVLDADLSLDCGLMPFRARHPERFFECGIAEQDMVSQAGAMALEGLHPVVHSFGCFLSTRPNEQIYNNATEGTRILYVGSLVGIVPGGPGHSHQSVRDISALGAMPDMALVEPYCEAETAALLHWAVREAPGSVYLRLVSVPWELGFEPPAARELVAGRGTVLREGDDGLIVTTGPVMVSQAWAAAERLAQQGVEVTVVALPWLRDIDGAWLAGLPGASTIFCVDNHYAAGGQGEAVLGAVSDVTGGDATVVRFAVDRVPECGTNDEVLRAHRLDGDALADRVRERLGATASLR